jgi:predicted nucleotidyltransferase
MQVMSSNVAVQRQMRRPLQAAVQDAVQRVIEAVHPDKVILFGSAARGDAATTHDIDLLVIKKGAHRRRMAATLYQRMIGVGWPVDIVVVTPEDVARYGHSPALVIEPALREGKVLYAA